MSVDRWTKASPAWKRGRHAAEVCGGIGSPVGLCGRPIGCIAAKRKKITQCSWLVAHSTLGGAAFGFARRLRTA